MQELLDAPEHDEPPPIDSLSGLLLILFSMPIGYLLLFLFVFVTARRQPWTFSFVDVLLWACAITIPLAQRRVEKRYGTRADAGRRRSLAKRLTVHVFATAVLWASAQSVQIL